MVLSWVFIAQAKGPPGGKQFSDYQVAAICLVCIHDALHVEGHHMNRGLGSDFESAVPLARSAWNMLRSTAGRQPGLHGITIERYKIKAQAHIHGRLVTVQIIRRKEETEIVLT